MTFLSGRTLAGSQQLNASTVAVFPVDAQAGATDVAMAQTALNACIAAGGGIVQFAARDYAWTGAVLRVPSNLTRRVIIRGTEATRIVLSSTANQFVGMVKTTANDIYRNVTVEGFTVDASALTADTTAANVRGGIIGPASYSDSLDVSWSDIVVRLVKGIGGPINTSITNQFIWIQVLSQTATAAPLQTIKRITLEDFDLTGGETGVYIGAGRTQTGATDAPNVTLDDIYCRRGRHTLPTPTGFLVSNNFIFGHRGRGLKLRVSDLYGYGCGDAGLEVDCWDDAVIERCTVEDSWNSAFYHTHYNVSATPSSQRIVYRDCIARRTGYTPTSFVAGTGQGYGWYQSSSSWANPARTRLERCGFVKTTTDLFVEGAAAIIYSSRGIVFEDFTSDESGIAYDANNGSTAAIQIRSSSGLTVPVRMRGVRFNVAGAKGTGADRLWSALRFPFGGYSLDLEDITVNFNVTGGVSATTVRAIYLGDDSSNSTLKGSVRRARLEFSSDASGWLFAVGPTSTTTIQPRILIEDCDIRDATEVNAATDTRTLVFFRVGSGSQQNYGGVQIQASTPGNAKWPATPAAITPGASPYIYRNIDGFPQRVIVQGGTVSALALSLDNTTFYDLGVTNGVVRLEPGDYLRVTYSVVPTMTKILERV